MGPWTPHQISRARNAPFHALLNHLGAVYKRDRDYQPVDPKTQSVRVHVNYHGQDFRFLFTGEKWVNELFSVRGASRGGGGAIDFTKHLCGCNFVQAVKICLEASDNEVSQ